MSSFGLDPGDMVTITGAPYVGTKGKVYMYYPLHQYGPVVQVMICEGKDKGKVITVAPNNVEFIEHGDPIPDKDLPKNSCVVM